MRLNASFIGRLVGRLLASLAVVFTAFWIAAYLPFTGPGKGPSVAESRYGDINAPQATETFASNETLTLRGVLSSEAGPGFTMEEVVLPGPCEAAGRRHLASVCPDCPVTEPPAPRNTPEVLFWVEGSGEEAAASAIFANCSEEISTGEVLVPILTIGPEPWLNVRNNPNASFAKVLPLPLASGPLSVLSLGAWQVSEYIIDNEIGVAARISDWLLSQNWTLPGEQIISDGVDQLVFMSESEGMLILTFSDSAEGRSLIAMHSKAGEQS